MQVSRIGFFSALAGAGTDMGYGYTAVELITAWQRLGIPVWTWDDKADVIFNFSQPHYFDRFDGKLNIGYVPWESTEVPKSWLPYMNRMDEIWTTCEANKKWYEDAGVVPPVKVLHHGINSAHWPLRKRTLDGPLKVLHIGGDADRKGADIVYKAFKNVFGDSDVAHLTLKGRRLSFKPEGPNVTHISDIVSVEELAQIHHEHHCMIYPTKGEGFGLIPFQAAATGMPTAVTNWSGPVDYMDHCYPIRVKRLVEPDYIPHIGLWAEPDFDDVCGWLRHFYMKYEIYAEEAYLKGKSLHELWQWDDIAKSSVEMMNESLIRLHK